jgi:hypothetical protein
VQHSIVRFSAVSQILSRYQRHDGGSIYLQIARYFTAKADMLLATASASHRISGEKIEG